jgi:hypothetical protein
MSIAVNDDDDDDFDDLSTDMCSPIRYTNIVDIHIKIITSGCIISVWLTPV